MLIRVLRNTLLAVALLGTASAPALAWDHHGGGSYPYYPAPRHHHHHRGLNDGAAIALGVGVGALLAAPLLMDQPSSPPVVYAQPRPVYVAPPVAYSPPPQTCREFQTQVVINGYVQPSYGVACLQPDGSWQIVR